MYSLDVSLLRIAVVAIALALVVLSQRYWFLRAWRIAGRRKTSNGRTFLRAAIIGAGCLLLLAIFLNIFVNFGVRHGTLVWRRLAPAAWTGLWLSSAVFGYLAAQGVGALVWLWSAVRRAWQPAGLRAGVSRAGVSQTGASQAGVSRDSAAAGNEAAASTDLSRRRFVHGATVTAGAAPFATGLYGFFFTRWNYQVRRVALPIAGLPERLVGLRIAQLSDIHSSSYMPPIEVRRAVKMANGLGADLTVVTGDFITRAHDPLEECIAELSRLRAPLGVWGCNGNHEIYANAEARAAELFARYGMRLLRQENAELVWHGQALNLIGVDYQRERNSEGYENFMLADIEPLVRHDVPNILLSHNPNSFRRAAELGIEAMLTGHTHGGQVRVEILDDRFSPARFLTPYVAGMYRRPLGAPSHLEDAAAWGASQAAPASVVYVNRGLGTIGVPVRLGVPPEITLHTLQRA